MNVLRRNSKIKKKKKKSYLCSDCSGGGVNQALEEFGKLNDWDESANNILRISEKLVEEWDEKDLSRWCNRIHVGLKDIKIALIGCGVYDDVDSGIDASSLCDLDDDELKFENDEKTTFLFNIQLSYLKIARNQREKIDVKFVNFLRVFAQCYFLIGQKKTTGENVCSSLFIKYHQM